MPYNPNIAARVREYLSQREAYQVEEKCSVDWHPDIKITWRLYERIQIAKPYYW